MTANFRYEIRIAVRYLFARKSHTAVNFIAAVSMAGVSLAVAAMVVVMSVFNGFADFTSGKICSMEAPLTIEPSQGKSISNADSIVAALRGRGDLDDVTAVVEERGFAIHGDRQSPVTLRGVEPGSGWLSEIAPLTIDGYPGVGSDDGPMALLSVGAANGLRAMPGTGVPVMVYEPKRVGRINPANPAAAFRADSLGVEGVFRSDMEEFDTDMMVVPLATARSLLNYTTEASFIMVYPSGRSSDLKTLARSISDSLGEGYRVLTPVERRRETMNMINVEKWVTTMMLMLILVIAAFNVLSTMAMLIAEKRRNMQVMRSLGATRSSVARIFALLGTFVTAIGGGVGIVVGCGLTLAQQAFGIVKMGVSDPSALALSVYPVRLQLGDVVAVALLLVPVALLTALVVNSAARRAID